MEDVAMNKYFKCEEKKQQLKTLNYLGDEYACLLKTENRDEEQQKRLEKLHWQLVESGGIGGWNTHEDNWLPKLKEKLKNDLKELDSLGAELDRTSAERTKAEAAYEYLQDFLKSDYDRIREQENLRMQIEKYHEGLELQENGTYKSEPGPTVERNAELDFIEEREEQRRLIMEQRRMEKEMREREARRSKDTYCR